MTTRRALRGATALVCLAVMAGLALGQKVEPPKLLGPFVARVTDSSAVIWWQGEAATPGKVVIGDRTVQVEKAPYEVLVTGLQADKDYRYHVELASGQRLPAQGEYTFHTAPAARSSREFTFAVLCDSRGGNPDQPVASPVLKTLLADARKRGAQFCLFPGDLFFGYHHHEAEYQRQARVWKAAAADFLHEAPIYVTMGNHDVLIHRDRDDFGEYDLDGEKKDGKFITGEEVFADEFVNPVNGPDKPEKPGAPPYTETCYSFDYGNCHFVVINTNYWVGTRTYPHQPGDPCRLYERGNPEGRVMDRQMVWLERDLAQARRRGMKHLFVFGHEPAFPVGKHVDDAMYYDGNATLSLKKDIRKRRAKLWNLFSRQRVLAAFFGDEHNYSRALVGPAGDKWYEPPVWHIITGGAGAPRTLVKMPKAAPGEKYVPPEYPHPYRRIDMPWSDAVRVFEVRYHYCLVHVHGNRVSLEVWALPEDFAPSSDEPAELELIDRVKDLTVRD